MTTAAHVRGLPADASATPGARPPGRPDARDRCLLDVGRRLQLQGYRFITVTPDTHALVVKRQRHAVARDLRDVFGWNLPFSSRLLPPPLLSALRAADALELMPDGLLRSRVRFSTIGERLFMHSAFPTIDLDAVFLGPDTYRFVHLLSRTLGGGGSLLEIGAGSGAAALSLADRYASLVMTDINPLAVRYARINAALAGCDQVRVHCSDLTGDLAGPYDAIIANPPYLIDPSGRWYRDGGRHGIDVALRMVQAAIPRIAPGGCFVLYSGSPVISGVDLLAQALAPLLATLDLPVQYDELEVDIFGSELAAEAYAEVERIAVVALIIGQPGAAQPSRVATATPGSGS
jgi:release factor glutamine methyltransferase